MRTFLRSKVTLLFMTLGLLLAIPAIALADIVVADGDGVVGAPHSGTRNLGSVNPGATLTPSVDFYQRCDGKQHFNSDDTANINFTSGVITDASNVVAATGSATATSLTNISPPRFLPHGDRRRDARRRAPAASRTQAGSGRARGLRRRDGQESVPQKSEMPVIALSTTVEERLPEKERVISVPWPSETKVLVERIEEALLDAPASIFPTTRDGRE